MRMLKKSNVSFATEDEENQYIEEEEEEDDVTCCGHAAFCFPLLRDIMVNKAIMTIHTTEVTWSNVFWLGTVIGMLLMVWTSLYFLLGDTMLPGGPSFGFFILALSSYFLGWSLAYLPYLNIPPVFGMLLAGIIIRNVGFFNIMHELGYNAMGKIKTFCISFIMLRAGLELTITPIRRFPFFVTILALVPCTLEMITVATCCIYILGYPWKWAMMTGTIVACMSPVVTVNCMLSLAERGYGEDKGLASLLSAASSIDDIHILSLFSIFYAVVFSDRGLAHWWSYIPPGITDLILGVAVGLLLGAFLAFFPHRNHKYVTWYRLAGLIIGSVMCTSSTSKLKVSGGPYLAIIIMSFVASKGWQILSISYNVRPFQRATYFLWHFMQPILVAVIGADIYFKDWIVSRFSLYLACIFMGIAARSAGVVLSTVNTTFSWKERLFIAFAWLPKGTLQAALAPMAYERTIHEDPEHHALALDVVRLSVISIVFLAPLGAVTMSMLGPVLLNKATIEERERERRLSYLRLQSLQPIKTRKSTT